jgi:hypothetical protein
VKSILSLKLGYRSQKWNSMVERVLSMFETLGLIPSRKKKCDIVGHWWLTPVILAIQEAEIRRVTV